MGLLVEYPMVIEIDNSWAVDLANNWSAGRKKHMQTQMFFLRGLKKEGILKLVWKEGDKKTIEMLTKNLASPHFNKYSEDFIGDKNFEWYNINVHTWESVGMF